MLPPLMLILQRPLLGYRASADKQISQICAHRARRFLSLSAAQIGRVAALLLSALRVAGRLAMPVMTQRASGDPVCLCIGALGVNVRTCRGQGRARLHGKILACRVDGSRELRQLRTEADPEPVTESNLGLCVPAKRAARCGLPWGRLGRHCS